MHNTSEVHNWNAPTKLTSILHVLHCLYRPSHKILKNISMKSQINLHNNNLKRQHNLLMKHSSSSTVNLINSKQGSFLVANTIMCNNLHSVCKLASTLPIYNLSKFRVG
jgi:hypothetical protein